MKYSEQANIAMKAKRVLQSATTKEQFDIADKYAELARNQITHQELLGLILDTRSNKYAEFYPAREQSGFCHTQGQSLLLGYLWGESSAEQRCSLQNAYNRQMSGILGGL